ncbi:DUF4249 domain-containing protein [Muricauda sp. 2012CJ35-5]|uniref:DUF4249 domain-containing protein n=1 Tax=Flagellimonas spongiicola TaxID=2942208 RepID=A0ABT0PP46_9FLAO|nr:DUF4249 domain-containing protein [Allomuricauda spongiicola]MCL6273160.1 DUF4249 domain-containing protein [Allomuricauda spongiicola]
MKSIYTILFLFASLFILGCSTEIDPDIEFEPQVFIFGGMGNAPGNVTFEIQQTVPVDNVNYAPINSAEISLFTRNQSGEESLITDSFTVNDGIYTSESQISPMIGNAYWVEIEIPGMGSYISIEETLKPVVEIKSIESNNNAIRVIFEDPADDTNLYYLGLDYFSGSDFLFTIFELTPDTIFNGNTEAFIESFEISGNSIVATLFNLNPGSYQFYSNLSIQEDNTTNDGDDFDLGPLFSTPPVNITGNIIDRNTGKAVLGNFGVISFSVLSSEF